MRSRCARRLGLADTTADHGVTRREWCNGRFICKARSLRGRCPGRTAPGNVRVSARANLHRQRYRYGRWAVSVRHSIVVAHGGLLWAENSSGAGSVFRVTLPRARDQNAAATLRRAGQNRALIRPSGASSPVALANDRRSLADSTRLASPPQSSAPFAVCAPAQCTR